MTDTQQKKKVLIIGGGAVGAIAALNLEIGGLATVTVVLRSNYKTVNDVGYSIESCDHGVLEGWKPSFGTSCSSHHTTHSNPCSLSQSEEYLPRTTQTDTNWHMNSPKHRPRYIS